MLEEPNEAAVPHEDPLLQDPRKRLPCGHRPPIRTRTRCRRALRGRTILYPQCATRATARRGSGPAHTKATAAPADEDGAVADHFAGRPGGVPFKLVGVGGHWHP